MAYELLAPLSGTPLHGYTKPISLCVTNLMLLAIFATAFVHKSPASMLKYDTIIMKITYHLKHAKAIVKVITTDKDTL